MVAATLVPQAGANSARYLQLSMALAVLVGVLRDEIGGENIFVSIRSAIASWHPTFR
jgi:hypothetical protein